MDSSARRFRFSLRNALIATAWLAAWCGTWMWGWSMRDAGGSSDLAEMVFAALLTALPSVAVCALPGDTYWDLLADLRTPRLGFYGSRSIGTDLPPPQHPLPSCEAAHFSTDDRLDRH